MSKLMTATEQPALSKISALNKSTSTRITHTFLTHVNTPIFLLFPLANSIGFKIGFSL